MKRIRESDLFADRHKHFGWTVVYRVLSFRLSTTIIFSEAIDALSRFRKVEALTDTNPVALYHSHQGSAIGEANNPEEESFVSSTSFTIHGGQPFK